MRTRSFISINCHPFHDRARIPFALISVARALRHYRRNSDHDIQAALFWHGDYPPPSKIRGLARRLALPIIRHPHRSNGENLNDQIAFAEICKIDFFFRMDADDTVRTSRFLSQAFLLTTGNCDMCGGALHYWPEQGGDYITFVPERPGTAAYLENRYVLHPSLAFKMQSLKRENLAYWSRRLEDKALILDACAAGLRIRNVPHVVGDYFVKKGTRSAFQPKWANLRLNIYFIYKKRHWSMLPYAVILFLAQCTLGPKKLRFFRSLLSIEQKENSIILKPTLGAAHLNKN